MLYKFKSKATANLIMLEPNGKQILRIIGKEPSPKGILEVLEMPRAIEALRQAVQQEEDTRAQLNAQNVSSSVDKKDTKDTKDTNDSQGAVTSGKDRPISLRQRAAPFIDMLQRAHKAGKDVIWGA
jgi:cyclopropane-fatty-acyl-phospholipid synthase